MDRYTEPIKMLGEGSFGLVFLVEMKEGAAAGEKVRRQKRWVIISLRVKDKSANSNTKF